MPDLLPVPESYSGSAPSFSIPSPTYEEMSRPATLAFRLFGNILAGEVLIIILLQLIPWYANWAPSCIWLMFSIFVGVIQAFVFTMLSITYITPSVHHK